MVRYLLLLISTMVIFPIASGGSYLRSPATARRSLETQVSNFAVQYEVPLVLALHYMNDETASQLEDEESELSYKFCTAVQQQAGDVNVAGAAQEEGVLIETMPVTNTTMECTMLDTNRVYDTGGELLGLDYFSLELSLEQSVYVSSNTTLALGKVRSLVENGYDRGRGGRVRFRELLRSSAPFAFAALLDIDVLAQVSPPQPAPTPVPSAAPSLSSAPSVTPTTSQFPSASPTAEPTTLAPSAPPSLIPSALPSLVPSFIPTSSQSPTKETLSYNPTLKREAIPATPTTSPTLAPTLDISNDQPSMMPSTESELNANEDELSSAAIAGMSGALAALLMGCCFLCLCCCKRRRKDNEQEDGAQDGRVLAAAGPSSSGTPSRGSGPPRKRHFSSRDSSSKSDKQDATALPIVPNVVELDDDNQSLANTTLGEHTAGRKPPKKKRIVNLEAARATNNLQSFDEESLYTSPGNKRVALEIQPSRRIDEGEGQVVLAGVAAETDDQVFFPASDAGTAGSSAADNEYMLDEVPPVSPMAAKVAFMLDEELGPESESDSSAVVLKEAESPISVALDKANATPSKTKRVEKSNVEIPKEDESSLFAFGDDEDKAVVGAPKIQDNDRDMIYASSSSESESTGSSRPSSPSDSRSSLTDKIGNLLPTTPGFRTFGEEEDEHQHAPRASPDAPGVYARSESMMYVTNGGKKVSATPTLKERKTQSLSPNHLPNQQRDERDDFSSKSASPSVRSDQSPLKPVATRSTQDNGTEAPSATYRTRYLDISVIPTPNHFVPMTPTSSSQGSSSSRFKSDGDAESKGINPAGASPQSSPSSSTETPSSEEESKGSEPAVLGATSSLKSSLVPTENGSVSSTSFTSEDQETPWLFETVEGALGPRSMSADLQSLSGKSTKSQSSRRSNKSSRESPREIRHTATGSSVGSKGSRRSRVSFGGDGGEEKSNEEPSLEPRTLEHDLRRLELQLAALHDSTSPHKLLPPPSPGASRSVVSHSSQSTHTRVSKKQRVVVVAPPGKLGLILANRKDGNGTVVAEVRPSSALKGALVPGDKLVAIDSQDVTGMVVSEITSIMSSKSKSERHLTVLTTTELRSRAIQAGGEAKSSSPY